MGRSWSWSGTGWGYLTRKSHRCLSTWSSQVMEQGTIFKSKYNLKSDKWIMVTALLSKIMVTIISTDLLWKTLFLFLNLYWVISPVSELSFLCLSYPRRVSYLPCVSELSPLQVWVLLFLRYIPYVCYLLCVSVIYPVSELSPPRVWVVFPVCELSPLCMWVISPMYVWVISPLCPQGAGCCHQGEEQGSPHGPQYSRDASSGKFRTG